MNEVKVSNISPHSKAIYESGKKILSDSVDSGRDFCKSMITNSLSAIPIYLALHKFIGENNPNLSKLDNMILLLPAFIFLLSAFIFMVGFFPIGAKFSLDIIEDIEKVRNKIIKKRLIVSSIGAIVFGVATIFSIFNLVSLMK